MSVLGRPCSRPGAGARYDSVLAPGMECSQWETETTIARSAGENGGRIIVGVVFGPVEGQQLQEKGRRPTTRPSLLEAVC